MLGLADGGAADLVRSSVAGGVCCRVGRDADRILVSSGREPSAGLSPAMETRNSNFLCGRRACVLVECVCSEN